MKTPPLRNMLSRTSLLVSLLLAALSTSNRSAQAQQNPGFGKKTAPIYGGTGIATQAANPFQGMSGTFAQAHKTPDGRACISVHPTTRPQMVNPKIIDQVVIVSNVCGQSIKVEICFAGSTDCIIVAMAGYQKVQKILGVASGSATFRYEYHELN
ncbi:hypothetical protein I3J27_07750 [Bradyrhizobium xenonodulans]|uniref:Uncharacterized protein n=1 Tax=Bradyrhizobium xenonodulans TaxID=2736875 RepID=A0ABY7MTM1_9BRAD|nr:hypothetical protein [Bradyrhizobium xenonodulans]WBL80305.1 hypothetical protein I3J27_07750 [Bradyrhizobium xenonodulans]